MAAVTDRLAIGILAHVDAGKTTLAESILYLTGEIRRLGRVDHRDAFLDTYELERARGITIFSKQAQVKLGRKLVTLLDTPGHVDFSAEMERTLQVMDYAVLVISGADGVQGHVETLWRLLKRYQIPVFLFINKMDQEGTEKEALLRELRQRLDERCVEFTGVSTESGSGELAETENTGGQGGNKEDSASWKLFHEELAMCDEELMERYLDKGALEQEAIAGAIADRKVFPCFFGSALRLTGVEELLKGLEAYTRMPDYPDQFGARVFKIARDEQGTRLTYLKVTGGRLGVKELLTNRRRTGEEQPGKKGRESDGKDIWEEKTDQIRIYSGAQYQMTEEAPAGAICAVTGLSRTYSGESLGAEPDVALPLLEPVLTYRVELPEECDVHRMLGNLRQLEEEIPELHIVWKEAVGEIHAQVMGQVQMEILKSLIRERFGVWVEFGAGSIVYKETIEAPVLGIGHFEPLRHYAEVHLLLEPGEPGSGCQFAAACSEDELDRNWQRLVLTHLEEKQHIGVLTGSEITDIRITLVAGRAHIKHTEGGDFRQATYRAVRQGLKKARSVLLEPVYAFSLELPSEMIGRAMTDIRKMCGSFEPPVIEGGMSILKGSAPVLTFGDYQKEVTSYTGGRGRLSCSLKGYERCHNEREVIEAAGYDSESDLENPTGSVFCAHGAGFVVSWDQVERYAQVDSGLRLTQEESGSEAASLPAGGRSVSAVVTDEELEEIFTRTYGPVKRERNPFQRSRRSEQSTAPVYRPGKREKQEEYLLVDGYNIIFAWEELRELAKVNIEGARGKLMDILCNYQGYRRNTVILVFDAYKVKGNPGDVVRYHNIYVVYTREAETADQYIEKTVHEIGKKYAVTVATSDALEQMIIWGQGASRMSAQGLKEEIESVGREIQESCLQTAPGGKNYPLQAFELSLDEKEKPK